MTIDGKKAQASLENLYRIFTVPEDERSTLHHIEQQISKNLLGFLKEHQVAGEKAPQELEGDFKATEIPEDPYFVSEQAEFLLSKVVSQSVHTSSPSFIGHMTSAVPYFMLSLAKIMTALNQNLVKIETSKAFTPLERQVIGMLHRLVYGNDQSFYDEFMHHRHFSIGTFCSGGTSANIIALWVARNQLLGPKSDFTGIMTAGLVKALRYYQYHDLALIVSERGHYSFKKAIDLLGFGKDQLKIIPVNDQQKIDLSILEQTLRKLRQQRIGIIATVGIAGTTETGNVDPLHDMADLCKEYGCHFHVDAAWGGPTLFSKTYAHHLKGIERADSVSIDAHKQLYVPIGAGMALFKDPSALTAIEQHAHYIIREGSRDLGKHSLEGSRPGMVMLVHSALCVIGRQGYELLIDLGIEKAKEFAKMIEQDKDFEVITYPELNLLTYRFVPAALKPKLLENFADHHDRLNELTINIQKEQRNRGKTFVSRTTLNPQKYHYKDTVVFRAVLANPLTTLDILKEILEEQRQLGYQLIKDL